LTLFADTLLFRFIILFTFPQLTSLFPIRTSPNSILQIVHIQKPSSYVGLGIGRLYFDDFVEISDGLRIEFDKAGKITSVAAGSEMLPLKGPGGFYLTEVLPPDGEKRSYGLLAGTASATKQGLRLQYRTETGLELSANLAAADRIEVAGEVRDTTGKDRALIVEFVLPIDCTGWTYENTPWQKKEIGKETTYPARAHQYTVEICRTGPPKSEGTAHIELNRLPFNALHDLRVGLSSGIPMTQPRIFFMSVDPRGMVVRFHLGVSKVTRKFVSRAGFQFCIYRHDPVWGIRSAAERFYKFYPQLFTSRATGYGNVCFGGRIDTDLPSKEDFGISYGENDFQWTDGRFQPSYEKLAEELGIKFFHWREPWSWFHQVAADVTAEEELALLTAQAEAEAEGGHGTNQYCGAPLRLSAKAALSSYMEEEDGSLVRVRHQYGCWMLAMNLDPELPNPNRADLALDYQFRWLKLWRDPGYKGPRNFAWDSCTGWTGQHLCNFRREHFPYADNPLTFNPNTGRLCQLKVLHDWEFAKHHSQLVRKEGGLIMANISPLAALFYGQHIDVFVRESQARVFQDNGIVMRLLIYQKPYAFYRPPDDAKQVRLAMFYGFAPGIDATGEQMRPIAQQYMPVIQAIGRAGWEPITWASAPGLVVERFGRKPGQLYFTARYQDEDTGQKDAKLSIDSAALGIASDRITVKEIAEHRALEQELTEGRLVVSFKIKFEETLAFSVEGK